MSDSPRVALVTGSTSGIGLAVAHALARRGVNVIITGFGDELTINGIVSDIKTRHNVKVDYIAADLSKLSEIDSLWSSVTKIYPDGVDMLINNAGLSFEGPVESCSDENWNTTLAVLLTAPFQLIKRCLPAMKEKGYGRIVNTSSVAGLVGFPKLAAYTSAKHGLIGLTKTVALETAANGITCNAVCPGMTLTPLFEKHWHTLAQLTGDTWENVREQYLSSSGTGKFVTPEQVAELVEFLCLSNASSQMTGAAYLIDHTYTAQ